MKSFKILELTLYLGQYEVILSIFNINYVIDNKQLNNYKQFIKQVCVVKLQSMFKY